eukprot:CAMPEP_0204861854 /NCGR_PEP_ID=MMETSP1348-20121228/1965_1 /ASSEMBLY_ACC=CAM_ASM_000700 /TAXON_ID=215587 /ORGANISM="Aplanochytrium stocchinoi, Strain GSBS06" /LENGTH=430 /DNA_ID=CAMNT_0052011471 /DNA_START=42 /DNA_END=1334 /DNA_ORIENTATION=-
MLVQIAGLCHDLGHGPFSHVWDNILPRISNDIEWNHEDNSVKLLQQIVDANKDDINLSNEDLLIITEMIRDLPKHETEERDLQGTWTKRRFFYLIVNNFESGLDVDKLDYLRRDANYTGLGGNKYDKLLERSRVMRCDDHVERICFPIDLLFTVFDLFQTRFKMHDKIYTHKVTKAIEYMIGDLIVLVADTFTIRGAKLPEACTRPDVFVHLNDNILDLVGEHIYNLPDNNKNKTRARDLYERIRSRKGLYKDMGHSTLDMDRLKERLHLGKDKKLTEKHLNIFQRVMYEYTKESYESVEKGALANSFPQDPDDLLKVTTVTLHYGKKSKNPVDMVYFINNRNQVLKGDHEEIRMRLRSVRPEAFMETRIQVFCKIPCQIRYVLDAFRKWCEDNKQMAPVSQAVLRSPSPSPTSGNNYSYSDLHELSDIE